jgi:hypothetical protein
MRTYGRWLNDALAQLAQALLWATPLAQPERSCDQGSTPNLQERLRETRRCLQDLLEAAQQHQPPARLDSTVYASAHTDYVDVVQRCVVALDCLDQGLATADEGVVRVASLELRELASAAADQHGRVIEWMLPFLVGPD